MAASAGTNITLNYQDTIDDPDTLESDFSEGDNNENSGNEDEDESANEKMIPQSRLKVYATIRSFENIAEGIKWIASEPFSKRYTKGSQDGSKTFYTCKGFRQCPKSTYLLNHAWSSERSCSLWQSSNEHVHTG